MKTREVAKTLRGFADFLDARPEFDTEGVVSFLEGYSKEEPHAYINFYDKGKFVEAVKSIGNATKTYTDGDYPKLEVTADAFPIKLSISRDKVCRKIVQFECDPLFSEEEVRSL
jgi:hypothetical protein